MAPKAVGMSRKCWPSRERESLNGTRAVDSFRTTVVTFAIGRQVKNGMVKRRHLLAGKGGISMDRRRHLLAEKGGISMDKRRYLLAEKGGISSMDKRRHLLAEKGGISMDRRCELLAEKGGSVRAPPLTIPASCSKGSLSVKSASRSSGSCARHCWQMTSRTPRWRRRRRVGQQAHCRGGWCGAHGGRVRKRRNSPLCPSHHQAFVPVIKSDRGRRLGAHTCEGVTQLANQGFLDWFGWKFLYVNINFL